MKAITFYLILFFIIILWQPCFSQTDTHYWTHQYGAKGLLLNGAVIASPEDESSIYYNPGAIGQDKQIGFSFSFLTPTFSTLRTNNFLGDGSNINDHGFGLSPGFLAVRFRPFRNQNWTAGVASFTRNESSLNYRKRLVGISSQDSEDLFRGDFSFHRDLTERWYGFGLSYNISDHVGIGVSQFSVWHDEELELKYVKEILSRNNPEEVILGLRNEIGYDFSINSSFLTKLGLTYHSEEIKLGLTFTSPSYGKLRTSANYAADTQTIFSTDSIQVRSNRRTIKLKEFKSPMSVGFGAEVKINKMNISFSTEYFTKIDPYFIFDDTDDGFDGLSNPPDEQVFGVSLGNQSVINFALGFQRKVNENRTWLWGLRTDFNQRSRFTIINNIEYLASTPDVFHFSGGGTFRFGKNVLSLGVDLGYGYRYGGLALTDLTDITRDNIFKNGQNENVENRFHSIMLFLTYDFIFSGIESM